MDSELLVLGMCCSLVDLELVDLEFHHLVRNSSLQLQYRKNQIHQCNQNKSILVLMDSLD
ncbi:MAG: hypothetical protein EBY07_13525 [Actinobacteria bacterium]|nr:hypothetical protein [Actinomycetota bacterium]